MNPYPRLNRLLAVLGVLVWLLSPVMLMDVSPDRHPILDSMIFTTEAK